MPCGDQSSDQGGWAFSVNLWDRDDTRVFVKFSKPASKEGDSLNGCPIRQGRTGVPIFTEAVAYVECRVTKTVELGQPRPIHR